MTPSARTLIRQIGTVYNGVQDISAEDWREILPRLILLNQLQDMTSLNFLQQQNRATPNPKAPLAAARTAQRHAQRAQKPVGVQNRRAA